MTGTICLIWQRGSGTLALTLAMLATTRSGHADMPTFAARLDIIWSTPITTEVTSKSMFGRSQGLVLNASTVAPDGTVILLGTMMGGQRPGRVLLRDPEKASPNAAVPINLPARDPPGPVLSGTWFFKRQKPNRNPLVLDLAIGVEGRTWLGGLTNNYTGFASDIHSDAYLATLDQAGKLLWERSYSTGGQLAIEDIAPTAAGGAIAIGHDWDTSWLARIAADGTLLSEQGFGSGKAAAAVPLPGDRFLIIGFNGESRANTYRDDLSAWVLDDAGALRGPRRVRDALNRSRGSHFGQVAASTVADEAYVASNWGDPSHPQAVEVARLGSDGAPLWRQGLPDTISVEQSKVTTYSTCNPALATLANGDALVACALNGEVQLYRFDRSIGTQETARLRLPDCHGGRPAALFLMSRPDGSVLLAGSPPGPVMAGGCSWLGRLVMPAS